MTTLGKWPSAFDPRTAPVFTHNEVRSTLPARDIWPTLVKATAWPQWYPHAVDVRIEDGSADIGPGSVFSWITLGVRVTTTVTEYAAERALGWEGRGRGARGYHRWSLTPTDDGGCHIVTEEVQVGVVPRLLATRLKRNLQDYHQEWLENLVIRSGGQLPHPDPTTEPAPS
jgi:hypothetical protein